MLPTISSTGRDPGDGRGQGGGGSGVAPTVLYRSFASKDALVTAYIERAEVRYREWFDEAVAKGDSTAERIDALFVALGTMTAAGSVSGLSVSR